VPLRLMRDGIGVKDRDRLDGAEDPAAIGARLGSSGQHSRINPAMGEFNEQVFDRLQVTPLVRSEDHFEGHFEGHNDARQSRSGLVWARVSKR
jgi:hypothetical protein